MSLPHPTRRAPEHQLLDPRLLGRPVHLLQFFADRFKEDLAEIFIGSLNRRYRAIFQVGDVSIVRTEHDVTPVDEPRWLTLSANAGRISFSMDRNVLMTVLHYRYGLNDERVKDESTIGHSPPATATEERLAFTLGLQLVDILALRIDMPKSGFEPEIKPPHVWVMVPMVVPKMGSWTLNVVIRELTKEVEGVVRFRLDESWMDQLLLNLLPLRDKTVDASSNAGAQHLGAQLPLTIVARLIKQDMPLGALMDMRVGDVIPVRLGSADVLVEDARLFQAAVAEHQGKLCLSSFEDTE